METSFVIHELKVALSRLLYDHWLTAEFATPQWWGIVVIIAVCYVVWWRLVDKRRLFELLFFGSVVAVTRILIDQVAAGAGLFAYSVRLLPLSPDPFLHEFTLTPLALMLVYQHSRSWRPFILGSAVVSLVICFVVLPVFSAVDILRFYNWNYFWSFLTIFGVACFAWAMATAVRSVEGKARQDANTGAWAMGSCLPAAKPLPDEEENDDS